MGLRLDLKMHQEINLYKSSLGPNKTTPPLLNRLRQIYRQNMPN